MSTNNINDEILYNSQVIDCKCQIHSWFDYHMNISKSIIDINEHFYNHIMVSFIPKVCCEIVKCYVGEIPYSVIETGYIRQYSFSTFGYVYFDDGYKVVRESHTCKTTGCIVYPHYGSSLCERHYYDQSEWYKLNR